ncbi:serine/threonine-protein kinase [Streptomyces arboris]|uniref:non-specific serine/threonine protein kinase n=1 Tax=Streptomyces arboris TaxID=2600619 RepID=A0A5N5EID9_9ACTN|nr:serine/threonine-protein kinase [Streptomyces arboris]KAB2590003.1 serine/threonine protein kinase [Streptomyces arboris]
MSGGREQHDGERYAAMEGIRPLVAGDPERIGPYPLLGRLGAGGMGRVYLARSAGGRTVAVKVVHEEHISNGEFRARFRREIEAARRVGGRYTAPVLDADADADHPWVATGYVPGPSLEQAVREHGPLPAESVHALAEGLLRALRGIHAAGIVHRDLKPSNVLLTVDGPRVIDFGIARALQVSVESLLTSTGMVIGSPGFMAPEQILGEETGTGADVFALGCVLMYAATGQLPFGNGASNQHAVMYRIVESAPDLSQVGDASLRELIGRCLTKKPAERPGVDALLAFTGTSESSGAALRGGAWLPPQLLARLARQAAVLLDADVPRAEGGGDGDPEVIPVPGADPEPVRVPEPEPVRVPESVPVRVSDPQAVPVSVPATESDPAPAPGAAPPPALVVAADGLGGKAPRRRRRTWVVAAAVLAVLATGSTVAFLQHGPGARTDTRDSDAAAPSGTGDGPSTPPSAGPTGEDGNEEKAKDKGKDGEDGKEKEDGGSQEEGKGKGGDAGAGEEASGGSGAPGGSGSGAGGSGGSGSSSSSGSGGGTQPGSGSSGNGNGGSGSGSGSGSAPKPPAADPDPPAPDNRVPQHFVGTWSIASQYDVLQPHTVVIRSVSPGQLAVTLVADVQGSGHCEYAAALSSVTDGGKRINVGAATVDKARSTGMCRDTDPSSFAVDGSGILHDVGPAHGSGYRYNRA